MVYLQHVRKLRPHSGNNIQHRYANQEQNWEGGINRYPWSCDVA